MLHHNGTDLTIPYGTVPALHATIPTQRYDSALHLTTAPNVNQ
jgi:hypothetical protein